MKYRSIANDITFGPPYIPDGFMDIARPDRWDFLGKKVLILSGADDKLVPWSASQEFVEQMNVGNGIKEVNLQAGVGHECTNEMVEAASEFLRRVMLT